MEAAVDVSVPIEAERTVSPVAAQKKPKPKPKSFGSFGSFGSSGSPRSFGSFGSFGSSGPIGSGWGNADVIVPDLPAEADATVPAVAVTAEGAILGEVAVDVSQDLACEIDKLGYLQVMPQCRDEPAAIAPVDVSVPIEAEGTVPTEAIAAVEVTPMGTEGSAPTEAAVEPRLPELWLPPGWEKFRAWAAEAPHPPSWWDDGWRPEEDRDELLFRADVNFFFALALEGTSKEERELKKEFLFQAERNFFFAKGLEERQAPPPPEDDSEDEFWNPSAEGDLLSISEPGANEDDPSVSVAREKIRKIAKSALSYEEKWDKPQSTPREKPAKRVVSIAGGDGTATVQRHWWENSASARPRQSCIKYPPSFGDLNI
jgi:hypothetical protein